MRADHRCDGARSARAYEFAAARADLIRLEVSSADLEVAAAEYVQRWPKHPPDFFVDNGAKRHRLMLRAFGNGEGWAARLISLKPDLCRYNLHTTHLELPTSAAAPALLFDPANIRLWQEAIRCTLSGPLWWRLEIGKKGKVHPHVFAGAQAGLLHIRRGGKIVQPVGDDLEAHILYLCKVPAPYTAENLAIYLQAKRRGRLPRLSGTMGLPNRGSWQASAEQS